jgi:hypothetical protein
MHGIVAAQALEIWFPDVVLVQARLADIDPVERERCSVLTRVEIDRSVHRVSSLLAGVMLD